jgi:outer membrane protein assembly factor BamE
MQGWKRARTVRGGSTCGVLIFVLILSGFGCDVERRRLMKEEYPSYPERIKRAINQSSVMRGMTEDQVYLSLGPPVCKKDVQREGKPVRVWLYPPIGRDACTTADFRVYFEGGQVVTWEHYAKAGRFTDPAAGEPR